MIKEVVLFLFLAVVPVSAHEQTNISPWTIIGIGTFLIFLFTYFALTIKKPKKQFKKILFWGICLPALIVTAYLIISTIYTNINSVTKGPVHWHTDYEIWTCDKKISPIDPTGLTNRLGSSLFHDHGDDRIHLEGTIDHLENVNLQSFFKIIGAELTLNSMSLQTNEGQVSVTNGQKCNDVPSILQVFILKVENAYSTQKSGFVAIQEKLNNPLEYVSSPYFNIPPGDCIIIEFGPEKSSTDKICETYKIALEKGDLTYGN